MADSARRASFDAAILDIVACPACMGSLRLDEARLVCADCARGYSIVDGIPVLIAGQEELTSG